MNSKEDQKNFKRSVASLISEELHLQRGMSVSEYTSVCRKAWNECQASPGFDVKVLIDPLISASQILAKSSDGYVHKRAGDFIDLDRTQSMEITCEAIVVHHRKQVIWCLFDCLNGRGFLQPNATTCPKMCRQSNEFPVFLVTLFAELV